MQVVLALIGVPLRCSLVVCLSPNVWTFTIRGDTIESCRGIIGRDVQSIRVQDLRNVNVRQTICGSACSALATWSSLAPVAPGWKWLSTA